MSKATKKRLVIRVPDIPHPTLCWKQKLDPPGVMFRCPLKKGHKGPHDWPTKWS